MREGLFGVTKGSVCKGRVCDIVVCCNELVFGVKEV